MRKLIFLAVTTFLALPRSQSPAHRRAPPARRPQSSSARPSGTRIQPRSSCSMGRWPNRSNAFGKCVSKLAQQNEQEHSNAAAQCRTERSSDPDRVRHYVRHRLEASECLRQLRLQEGKGCCRRSRGGDGQRREILLDRAKGVDLAAFKARYGNERQQIQRVREVRLGQGQAVELVGTAQLSTEKGPGDAGPFCSQSARTRRERGRRCAQRPCRS